MIVTQEIITEGKHEFSANCGCIIKKGETFSAQPQGNPYGFETFEECFTRFGIPYKERFVGKSSDALGCGVISNVYRLEVLDDVYVEA